MLWQKILFIAVVVSIFIVSKVSSRYSPGAARKRRDGLSALAQRLNLTFSPDNDYGLVRQFDFLKPFAQGMDRYAYNLLSGNYRGYDVRAFDYHYEGERKNKNSRSMEYRFSVLILLLPVSCPDLTIRPENFFRKAAEKLGGEDIQFESAEFSKAFRVRCVEKKFAYDICNPRMMEYLLANRDLSIEIQYQVVALVFDSFVSFNACLPVDKIEYNLNRLAQIRSLMPDYLFTQNA